MVALALVGALTAFGAVWLRTLELASPPALPWRRSAYQAQRRTEVELARALESAALYAGRGASLRTAVDATADEHASRAAQQLRAALLDSRMSPGEGPADAFVVGCARALERADARGEGPEYILGAGGRLAAARDPPAPDPRPVTAPGRLAAAAAPPGGSGANFSSSTAFPAQLCRSKSPMAEEPLSSPLRRPQHLWTKLCAAWGVQPRYPQSCGFRCGQRG